MNINGFLCFLLLVKLIQTYEGDNNTITIGVISNGRSRVSMEQISVFEKNVTLVRHWIDTSEIYHIFRSIKTLDADADVDVIVLFDYDPTIIRMPDLFTTTRKKLIKWGERMPYTKQSDGKSHHYIDPDDICGAEQLSDFTSEDPYCIHDDNVTVDRRSERLVTLLGPKALTVLVKALLWKAVYIFYETSTETEASDLVDSLSREGVLLSLFNIDKVSDLNSLIHQIYKINIPHNKDINIIVLCRFACARELLRTANAFDSAYQPKKHLLKLFSRWLVAVYGHSRGVSRALQACAKDLDNVAVVAFPEVNGNGTKGFRKTLDSIVLDVLQEEVSSSHLDVKRAFLDRLETAAATWSPKRNCLAYNIDTLLHKENGRSFSSAGYIEVNGNVEVHSDLFPNSKFGYNKRHFTVATLPYKPFVMKRKINGTVKYQGFCIDLLKELATRLNFTFTITEPSDGKWGTYEDSKNLSFNGLSGMLQREEVDIVAAPISTTSERSKVADFSYPFFYEYTSVLMKKPDVNATKWRTLIDPFKWEVLVSIGLSLTMITILAFLLEKYNPFYDAPKHAEERQRNGGIHTWHSSFWYMYGALLCQGGVHLPDSTSGRTLVSFWWLFCIIIVGTYSGNLIAFLTVTKEKPPFNTLAEMTKRTGSYKWGTLSGTYLETTFLKSKNPTYKAVGVGLRDFNRTDPDVMSADPQIHIRKVKGGKYAWIGDKTSIENAMATECSLMSIKEDFLPLKYAFGFTRNSPHTDLFSKQIIKLHEGGLFQIWKRQWWPNATFCAGNTVTEAKPISLMDVQSAFYVCSVGVVLGLCAFLLEVTVYKCRKKTRKATNNINGDIELR